MPARILKETCGFTLDLRQSGLSLDDLKSREAAYARAHEEMKQIEAGAIKNPDEGRRVTHFTDRQTYPGTALFARIETFFREIREGKIRGSTGQPFDAVIINGIGGSALGPQLVQFAMRGPYWNERSREERQGNLRVYFVDNTDAAGLFDVLQVVDLKETLCVHISKSGGTRETRNNMMALEAAYAAAGLDAAAHFCAVTMEGSKLWKHAQRHHWLELWPMAESIGGRTSETAVVGHVPAAAAGIDFRGLLAGACEMDAWTREANWLENPAYLLAAAWYALGNGKGERNMVIVPYADRLILLSRYLQQLVMESLGKEFDRQGNVVHQGLTVYGNKGGTDAHAFIQQLNDGRNDFFVTFIEILKDRANFELGEDMTMGLYLHNFLQGLSNALAARNRPVITIRLDELNEQSLGMIIALYERSVAFYAELIDINAFHQPGVEAYKKISTQINTLAQQLQQLLRQQPTLKGEAAVFAKALNQPGQTAEVEGILLKLAAISRDFDGRVLQRKLEGGTWVFELV